MFSFLTEQGDATTTDPSSAKTSSDAAIQILGKDFVRLSVDVAESELQKKLKPANVSLEF